jgi:hypothetical protein
MTDTLLTVVENSPMAQEIAGKVISAVTQAPEITWEHIALTVIGALMVNLINYDEFKKSGDKLGFLVWVDKNWISLILSSLSLVTMFLLKDELKDIAGFSMNNRVGAFFAGFTTHVFVSMVKSKLSQRFQGTVSPNSPTPPNL